MRNSQRFFYWSESLTRFFWDKINQYVATFKYDTGGNLVETTDSQGNITQYEFDNKINPYFLMKRSPDALIAYYVSPNNVVKIINLGSADIEIKYEYKLSKKCPLKCLTLMG